MKLPPILVIAFALTCACTKETDARARPAEPPTRDVVDYSAMTWNDFKTTMDRNVTSLEQRLSELKADAKKAGRRAGTEIDSASDRLSERTSELRRKLANATEDAKDAGRQLKTEISDTFTTLKRDVENAFR